MPDTTELPEQRDDKEFEIPIKPPLISEFVKMKKEKEEIEKKKQLTTMLLKYFLLTSEKEEGFIVGC